MTLGFRDPKTFARLPLDMVATRGRRASFTTLVGLDQLLRYRPRRNVEMRLAHLDVAGRHRSLFRVHRLNEAADHERILVLLQRVR